MVGSLLSELNRFTINSVNHNHNNAGRQARRDDINEPWNYWLRSAGASTGSPVAAVWTFGTRGADYANITTFGFRPIL